jgi:hypothetical protein
MPVGASPLLLCAPSRIWQPEVLCALSIAVTVLTVSLVNAMSSYFELVPLQPIVEHALSEPSHHPHLARLLANLSKEGNMFHFLCGVFCSLVSSPQTDSRRL